MNEAEQNQSHQIFAKEVGNRVSLLNRLSESSHPVLGKLPSDQHPLPLGVLLGHFPERSNEFYALLQVWNQS